MYLISVCSKRRYMRYWTITYTLRTLRSAPIRTSISDTPAWPFIAARCSAVLPVVADGAVHIWAALATISCHFGASLMARIRLVLLPDRYDGDITNVKNGPMKRQLLVYHDGWYTKPRHKRLQIVVYRIQVEGMTVRDLYPFILPRTHHQYSGG